jgi:hypothetical protein
VINRSRLRVDTRKWRIAKMHPKKYGEASLLKIGDPEGNAMKFNAIFTDDTLQADNGDKEDS